MRPRTRRLALLAAAVAVAGMTSLPASGATGTATQSSCPLPRFGPGATYHPVIERESFSPNVTNPWLPLPPGRTYVYVGVKDGQRSVDVVVPSHRTKVIDGVRTRVVYDRLYLRGVLSERTTDYYAQDRCGNVWYFGEDTAELDSHGNVIDTSGSFHAGIGGAQPGVFMQAHPEVGRWFRQEWSAGEAEDQFKVRQEDTPVTVPYGSFQHALLTKEVTALEPGVVDNKYYVRGIGSVLEVARRGPAERLVLVDILS